MDPAGGHELSGVPHTGSALLLGVVGFISQIPSLMLAPIAGVLADHGG